MKLFSVIKFALETAVRQTIYSSKRSQNQWWESIKYVETRKRGIKFYQTVNKCSYAHIPDYNFA